MKIVEWNAKFERDSCDGREVTVGKCFQWGGCTFHVPSVYICDEGLIIDFCIKADREEYCTFLEKWRHLFDREKGGGKPTKREWRQFEYDNPLDRMFETAVWVNGRQLKYKGGYGMQWIPDDLIPIMRDEIDIKPFMEHYGLDPDQVWEFRRDSYYWDEEGSPELETLDLKLSQRPRVYPGTEFPTPKAGESVTIADPLNGAEHVLTVTEIRSEKIQRFRHENLLFPECCIVMCYTLEPELPKDVFFLEDTAESDQPKQMGNKPAHGSAIGIIVSNREKPEGRYTVSSMHFEPVEKVTWQAGFRYKTEADMTVILL